MEGITCNSRIPNKFDPSAALKYFPTGYIHQMFNFTAAHHSRTNRVTLMFSITPVYTWQNLYCKCYFSYVKKKPASKMSQLT